jgi:hypothetical protein
VKKTRRTRETNLNSRSTIKAPVHAIRPNNAYRMPRNENELQKTRSVGDGRAGGSRRKKKNDARTSRVEGLDINVVSYKYEDCAHFLEETSVPTVSELFPWSMGNSTVS